MKKPLLAGAVSGFLMFFWISCSIGEELKSEELVSRLVEAVQAQDKASILQLIQDNPKMAQQLQRLLEQLEGGEEVQVDQKVAKPSTEPPILGLDPGGHMGLINGVVFTPDGRQLVSAGDDKVIRVWDVAKRRTVRTLRGEIGAGTAGKIFALALSPDGRWLAVGGYMATFTEDNHEEVGAIRVYDFASGELVMLLKGHSNVVNALAFGPDSRRLISGSADNTAIVWDITHQRVLHTLNGHTDHIYAVDFTPDGERVVTGSYDHTLRLWQMADGALIETLEGHADKISAIAVSPRDGTIASGSADHTIRLWDGRTGQLLRTLADQGTNIGSLSFSPDGQYLLSGVGKGHNNDCHVFRVTDGREITRYEGHDNIVLATAISVDGHQAATGGADGEIHLWSLLDGRLEKRLAGVGGPVLAVGFSADGQLAWGKTPLEALQVQDQNNFGVLEYALTLPTLGESLDAPEPLSSSQEFRRAQLSYGALRLTTRAGGPDGRENAVLEIRRGDEIVASVERGSNDGYGHRTYTFTVDGQTVISGGANGVLTAYDIEGRNLGDFVGHTGDVFAVAVSPDGRFLASGSADQTVRLWDVWSRKPLVTLFYGSNGEWIAWTPSGYYAASPKGDHYVGWHLNRGLDKAAKYYPAARFASKRYRPELTANVVALGSEAAALGRQKERDPHEGQLSIAELIAQAPSPPELLSAPSGVVSTAEQVLEVAVDKQTERLVVTVNGRPVRGQVIKTSTKQRLTETVTLSPGINQIELIARNQAGDSPAVALEVEYQPDIPDWEKPNLYVLAIGVSEYADSNFNLDYAHQDAEQLAMRFQREAGGLYHEVHVKLLINTEARKDTILDELDFLHQMAQGDLAILFIAGHGMRDSNGHFYFLAHDTDEQRLRSSAVRWREFQDVAADLPGKVILLADTCHSAAIAGQRARRALPDMTQLAREFADAETGVIVFTSSQGQEFSEESPEWGHGAFTKALLDGLKGEADWDGDGVVHQSELDAYVTRQVVKLTSGRQHPITVRPDTIADFPLAQVQ